MPEAPSLALQAAERRIADLELELKKLALDFGSLWAAHGELQQAVKVMTRTKPKGKA